MAELDTSKLFHPEGTFEAKLHRFGEPKRSTTRRGLWMFPAEMETEHGLIRAYLIANLSTCVLFMSLVKELSNRPARIQVNHRTIGEDVYVSVTWLPYREEI